MRKLKLMIACMMCVFAGMAEEGMWMPMLLKQWNQTDMQNKGFKLTADDIYSVNKTSMKDAVLLFGAGCTGELVSAQGLLITNHHCGYSNIQALSTMENNMLDKGFWAYSMDKELPCPGLSVTFIIRIEDVTSKIVPFLNDTLSEANRDKMISQLTKPLIEEAVKGTHYEGSVRPFYYGNEFYLFVTETFNDVRFVGAPPSTMGNFGGETDNWVWPRHTADFSMFRIYANADNKPAKYSPDNVPFKSRYFFPISTKGIKDGDFTMVYGFPGRTQEYVPSVALDFIVNQVNPTRVNIRDKRLEQINYGMQSNDTTRLQYSAKARSLANAYKKWKGEMTGINKSNAMEAKRVYEKKFSIWVKENPERIKKYGMLLKDFDALYAKYKPYAKVQDYTNEAANAIEVLGLAGSFNNLIMLAENDTTSEATWLAACKARAEGVKGFFKNYDTRVDKNVFIEMMCLYRDSIAPDNLPGKVKQWDNRTTITVYADRLFKKSAFASQQKLLDLLVTGNKKKIVKLRNDEAFALFAEINNNYVAYNREIAALQVEINKTMRTYMKALREYDVNKMFYPDANSTLRITYGNVKPYNPRNGVIYLSSTTAAGIREKYNPADEDYATPAKLISLIDSKDYGTYAENGELPVAFIATNHTTGGNSGSPVLNANGELIGTNYDREWEGIMSDMHYDVNLCRNISLDVRYTLFIIDKFAGATNLIKEMKLVE